MRTYSARLQRVLSFIDGHLVGDLCVAALADVAGVSKFHFHRVFTAFFGMGVYRFVRLVRLKRAAWRLAYRSGDSVLEIALDAGYESPEAFARAFKQRAGQTPSEFRAAPDWTAWEASYEPVRQARRTQVAPSIEVKIVEFPETRVAALEHRGPPSAIPDSIRRFIAWRKSVHLPPWTSATFNLLYDDPETTAPERFRLDLCAATTKEIAPSDAGIVVKIIPSGRCATFRYQGSDEGFEPALHELYSKWLPQSGEEPRDFPLFCQRVKFFPDVPEHEAITDFFLPLR
jgi:AraC family transcriptional regulator